MDKEKNIEINNSKMKNQYIKMLMEDEDLIIKYPNIDDRLNFCNKEWIDFINKSIIID
jgi:hypothetical protein